jgi:hypothetical protein
VDFAITSDHESQLKLPNNNAARKPTYPGNRHATAFDKDRCDTAAQDPVPLHATHASWLNMAEIEIGILQHQCLARCAAEQDTLATEVTARQRRRNAARCGIEWTFTRRDADRKLSRHYVS